MLIDIKKAAEILPFTEGTIRVLCCKKQIPHRHVRRSVVFDEDDLSLWCTDGGNIDLHFKVVGKDVVRQ